MRKCLRASIRLLLLRVLIGVLSFVTLLPPVGLAQMFGGGLSQQQQQQQQYQQQQGGGGAAGGLPPGFLDQLSGQAKGAAGTQGAPAGVNMTNPTALQNLTPVQSPCPRPQQMLYADFLSPTLNEVWPMAIESLLPPTLEQRMKQEREAREEQHDKQQHEKEKHKREQEARQQAELQRAGGSALNQQMAPGAISAGGLQGLGGLQGVGEMRGPGQQTAQHEISKDYDTEEAFARFSVLQGVKARLKQFGYDFFDVQASTFSPLTDVPVGPDYVVGPRDSLAIHIWNVPDQNLNRSIIAMVDSDGVVVVPQVGAIPVGGLAFSMVERVISDRLKSLLKRFEVHVSLARLRTIKVFVVGEVSRPGAYELSSLAAASNAVYAACGSTKNGSLRQIRVMREGKFLSELDLYDVLVTGDRSGDRRLQSGDVIVVPPIVSAAAISGAVRRSAIYELKPDTHLSDLLSLAGGLTAVADQKRCHIFRLDPSRGRIILDVDLGLLLQSLGGGDARLPNSKNDPLIRDGDYVRVASIPTQVFNAVSLVGAVKSPGPYEYRSGMTLDDLLTPEQLTSDAHIDHAELVRTDPVTFQSRVIPFSPKALFEGKKDENHPLQRLDQVVLSSQVRTPSLVSVEGEVRRPGYFTIEFGERLSSALKRAGGFSQSAFPRGIMLIRESVKEKQTKELERFVATQKQQLTAQSAAAAGGAVSVAGGGAALGSGSIAEQQVLAIRMQHLESIAERVELGRVVVTLESLESLEGSDDDLRLEAHDIIKIPSTPQTVTIIGSVRNPVTVSYKPGLKVADYIKQAGGVSSDANNGEMYIVRANGATEVGYWAMKEIGLGDTIVVPQKIEILTPPVALWSTVASVFSSLMIAITAITVLGR